MMGEVVSRFDVGALAARLRGEGKRIVFTNGCFDILHVGHVRYLREAAKLGDVLIVGLNTDDSVRRIKGDKRPLVPLDERAEMLVSLSVIDYVTFFDEDRPDVIISEIKPDFHVKGGDYDISEIPEREVVDSYGGKVVIIPEVAGKATTNIVSKVVELYGRE